MKLRRGMAKLLAAVIIVELVLSSFNQNQYPHPSAKQKRTDGVFFCPEREMLSWIKGGRI